MAAMAGGPESVAPALLSPPPSSELAPSTHFMHNMLFFRVCILDAWVLMTCLYSQGPASIHLRQEYEYDHSQFSPLATTTRGSRLKSPCIYKPFSLFDFNGLKQVIEFFCFVFGNVNWGIILLLQKS